MPLKALSQNDFTNKEVDVIFDLINENDLFEKNNSSLINEIESYKKVLQQMELKYNFSVQKENLKNNLFAEKLKNKDLEIINQKKLWQVKRNNAYFKGGLIGVGISLVGIILIR